MKSLLDFITEAAMSPEDKAINKLFGPFVNNYDNEIGKMLEDNGILTVLTRGYITSEKRTIFTTKLWKGMLHRVTPLMKKEFKCLQGHNYEYAIVITAAPENGDKRFKPDNFFEVENVGIYVKKNNGTPFVWNAGGGKVRDDRESFTCYLFFNLD